MPQIACKLAIIMAAGLFAAVPCIAKTAKPHPARKHPATPPGGANQVQGLNGKIGDVLFDGYWRFQVISINPVSTYTLTVPSSEPALLRRTWSSHSRAGLAVCHTTSAFPSPQKHDFPEPPAFTSP